MKFFTPQSESDLAQLTPDSLDHDLLVELADAMRRHTAGLVAMRDDLLHDLDCATPPPALVDALRQSPGTPRVVVLTHDQAVLRAAIYPTGMASPKRERLVWRGLVDYIHDHR